MKIEWMRTMLMVIGMGPASAIVSGCADDPEPPPLVTATAMIERNRAADGCDYLVTIDSVRYAPDAASRAEIDDSELSAHATVTIGYRLTGKTGVVECGEGTSLHLPEISLELARTLGQP
jgi:hypothetical protein